MIMRLTSKCKFGPLYPKFFKPGSVKSKFQCNVIQFSLIPQSFYERRGGKGDYEGRSWRCQHKIDPKGSHVLFKNVLRAF